MRIVLSGVETNNKGAELMLYAILQEIERKFGMADVYIKPESISQGLRYVQTGLNLRYWPYSRFKQKYHLDGIARRLHLSRLLPMDTFGVKRADYFIDDCGFFFSDQWNIDSHWLTYWERLLKRQKDNGARIIFLPQAFGPVSKNRTRDILSVLSTYATVIMPREQVSYNYLKEAGTVDMEKVKLFPDFTSLVDGLFPAAFKHLENGVCIIPNVRMIDKGVITLDAYLKFISSIVEETKGKGHPVYLLNHEGIDDERLAFKCRDMLKGKIEVVTGLNALEVKGLIASAFIVVSSRFHGVASALNSSVPCLATSWSHKYAELYKDYGLDDCVLDIMDIDKCLASIQSYMEINKNKKIRVMLEEMIPHIHERTRNMWETIWSL